MSAFIKDVTAWNNQRYRVNMARVERFITGRMSLTAFMDTRDENDRRWARNKKKAPKRQAKPCCPLCGGTGTATEEVIEAYTNEAILS